MVSLLNSWGVANVPSGDSLAWVRSLPPQDWDLVLSDHRLGDGTGREVIQHLRTHQPALPAILLTGDTSPEQLAELARSGVPVLHKPVLPERLREAVASTLAARRAAVT
jgi:CheY-like chemotaxis protein